jgi:hypothetical protein
MLKDIILQLIFVTSIVTRQIVVIDSGFDMNSAKYSKYIKNIISYTSYFGVNGTTKTDFTKHGSEIVSIIVEDDPNAEIHIIKIFGNSSSASPSYLKMNETVTEISNNSTTKLIINLSFGGPYEEDDISDRLGKEVISHWVNVGHTVVISAGNSNTDACFTTPARIKSGITVGACKSEKFCMEKNKATYSNFGSCVDTYRSGFTLDKKSSGTSFSAPRVVAQINKFVNINPSATQEEIFNYVITNGVNNTNSFSFQITILFLIMYLLLI